MGELHDLRPALERERIIPAIREVLLQFPEPTRAWALNQFDEGQVSDFFEEDGLRVLYVGELRLVFHKTDGPLRVDVVDNTARPDLCVV